jgi:hypothetical protein
LLTRKQRRRALQQTRRQSTGFNAGALLVGALLVYVSVDLQAGSNGSSGWGALAVSIAGGALISAALVSFVLGSITMRETTLRVEHAVGKAIEDILEPVRETVYAEALKSYRWDCHLDAPPVDDPLPEHGYQSLRISYTLPDVPSELRVICVASHRDDVLKRYGDDERYVFRWIVDDYLDPTNPTVFAVGQFRLDGEPLPAPRKVSRTIDGQPAVEYRWRTKGRGSVIHEGLLELRVSVRKFIGREERVRLATTVFRTATDAEFRLSVGEALAAQSVRISTGEVTRLGPDLGDWCGPTFADPHAARASIAVFRHPLQRGSGVSFTVERAPIGLAPLLERPSGSGRATADLSGAHQANDPAHADRGYH